MKKYLYKSNRTFSIITAAFVVVIIAIFLVGIQASNTVAAGYPERISVASDGTQGNGSSADYPSISADGRYISFQSNVTNLVPGDTNDQPDIFVHDRQTGETERVSVASDGSQGNDRSGGQQAISADGRFVSFQSLASNLV